MVGIITGEPKVFQDVTAQPAEDREWVLGGIPIKQIQIARDHAGSGGEGADLWQADRANCNLRSPEISQLLPAVIMLLGRPHPLSAARRDEG